jgi:hypothetical protein
MLLVAAWQRDRKTEKRKWSIPEKTRDRENLFEYSLEQNYNWRRLGAEREEQAAGARGKMGEGRCI